MFDETLAEPLDDVILRYVDEYRWGWGVVHRQMRLHCGVDLTTPELKALYRDAKSRRDEGK